VAVGSRPGGASEPHKPHRLRVATTIADVRAWRHDVAGSLGLVPTMGALHAGHLALVARARRDNNVVAASVFVNPTQFAPHEDLSRYPRSLERDRAMLADAGVDLLFAPEPAEMYPAGFATGVELAGPATRLEGERRPGHFRGVATVVLKLLNLLAPHRAYFGQKDAQQLAVVRRMARDLDLETAIVACPTVREPDGLALSSRNVYLTPEDRRAATVLHRALEHAVSLWAAGVRDATALRRAIHEVLEAEPRARVDYVALVDPRTFAEAEGACDIALALLAVYFGTTRLIDNTALPPDPARGPEGR
jgi:pantoate--beta-alanine ligase